MDWDDLRVVLAIARGGTLSAAGRRLRINQTTAGRRLKRLERRLGAALFVRGRPVLLATEAGESVIAHAERMESQTLSLAGELKLQEFKPQGLVRIATMPWIIAFYIIPALPDFAARYPGIEIETIGDVRERSLSKREAELALRFETEPRGRERAVNLASISYALYAPRTAEPDQLPWIAFGEDVAYSLPAQWIEQARGPESRIVLRAHDVGMIHAAIRAGVGKGLIPEVLGEHDPALLRLSGDAPEFVRNLRALVHEDMQQMTRTVTVIDWLKEVTNQYNTKDDFGIGSTRAPAGG
jgi:DNA-binding transcriptional LysR family regulator